ncbi:MAG: Shedu anti-phage system protein SduA domain-containing protein [Candidatus Pacearchaeota archaeon]
MKTPYGWQYNRGFNIRQQDYLSKLINSLRKIANKIGWSIKTEDEDIESIKSKIREQQEIIIELEKANNDARKNHDIFIDELKKKQELLIKKNANDYLNKIAELKQKIEDTRGISENDLQNFLYENSWMFGIEYINTEPQKLRGAHSKFDFYLQRYNLTNDIIEIKLISDQIINKDGSVSAKVIQAVDQIMEYMESSQAVAHSSVLSDEEEIKELRPRGIVIIGKDYSKEAVTKLRKWNYQFAHIKIMTYNDVLKKSEVFGNYIKKIIDSNNITVVSPLP